MIFFFPSYLVRECLRLRKVPIPSIFGSAVGELPPLLGPKMGAAALFGALGA